MPTVDHYRAAIANVVNHGDTDIYPFPVENHLFFDQSDRIVSLLGEMDAQFKAHISQFPPSYESTLVPVSYTGFRWGTQMDPLWNLYFLSCAISIGEQIEAVRIPKARGVVFSYRFKIDPSSSDIFDRDMGWLQFMEKSMELASQYDQVVTCDIAEFYPRLGHHRLENALEQAGVDRETKFRIMFYLKDFSNTRSFGLPIGGPAARLLSELVLDQIDKLLAAAGVVFCRFADDYHLFANGREDAHEALVFLGEKLFLNQGLSLQKSKTRIMTGAEFISTSPVPLRSADDDINGDGGVDEERGGGDETETHATRTLLRLSIRFDPYSLTAEDDYENLKSQIRSFRIVELLRNELAKSRIHAALSRKLISAIRYLETAEKSVAARALVDNLELLYPILSSVLVSLAAIYDDINEPTKRIVNDRIREAVVGRSYLMRVDSNLAFAIRLLSKERSPVGEEVLARLYRSRTSPMVRRDIILVMARWRAWYWLSDIRNEFRVMGSHERRAFLVASFVMGDEGRHWRRSMKDHFSPFEREVRDWAISKIRGDRNWGIPI